jgi:membrane peptidoglycan carboxypeptidase
MSAQKSKPVGVLGAVLGLIGFSALAGVLVTAMVTPALAVTSMTAKNSIGVFENLPDFIKIGDQSQQNQIYAMLDGKPVQIATTYKQNRKEVTWDNVSPYLKNGAVAGEDRRFYDHGGVDMPSIIRASILNTTQSENGTSGSSTLDMQLVRNILVQQAYAITDPTKMKAAYADAVKQTLDRKLKEMKLAIGLDKRYTKKQILLGYLNIVGMGSNTYGVESAAEQYFSVSAKDVTLAQAASLIAIVQQPNLQNLSNAKNYPANKVRRDQILSAMLQEKYIDQKQYTDAVNTTIESEVKLKAPDNGCRNAQYNAGVICDYVTKLITAAPANGTLGLPPQLDSIGATPAIRQANWDKGGYQIYTSIDLGLQQAGQASMVTMAPATETRFAMGAAADTVEVGTGRVLAMVQNKAFDDAPGAPATATAVNFSTDYPYGGSTGFPTGSTYKVFDLANWLQNGHGLNDLVNGASGQTYKMSSFSAPCDPAAASGADFTLRNDSGGGGVMTVKAALIASVNNAFMQMATRQDLCSIRDTAITMGAHRADGKPLTVNPSAILGTNEIAPLTMAAAVATIGGNGVFCQPIIVDKVVNPDGKTIAGQTPTCGQALTPDVTAGVAAAMQGSMQSGTSSPGNPRDGNPIGGKTGTSPTADHVWIMGTTTKVATAVWTGNIVGHQSTRTITIPGTRSSYAALSRFAIFKAIQGLADKNPTYKGGAFGTPSAAMLGGASAVVPDVSGQTPELAKSVLESAKFIFQDGGPVASALPAGKVVSTDPPAGTKTPVGQTIIVYTSDGSLATTMPTVVGQTKSAALALIVAAGFSSSNVQVQWVATTPATASSICKVQSSDPAGTAAAAKSDPITLKVYGDLLGNDPHSCN